MWVETEVRHSGRPPAPGGLACGNGALASADAVAAGCSALQFAEKPQSCHSEGGVCPRNLLVLDCSAKSGFLVSIGTPLNATFFAACLAGRPQGGSRGLRIVSDVSLAHSLFIRLTAREQGRNSQSTLSTCNLLKRKIPAFSRAERRGASSQSQISTEISHRISPLTNYYSPLTKLYPRQRTSRNARILFKIKGRVPAYPRQFSSQFSSRFSGRASNLHPPGSRIALGNAGAGA